MDDKLTFQERALKVRGYHIGWLKIDKSWNIAKTAMQLDKSIGSVCQDLMIADWIRVYPSIEKMTTIKEALEFIRDKKREMRVRA